MLKQRTEERTNRVLSALPSRLSDEVARILRSRRNGFCSLRELRVRAEARTTVICDKEMIPTETRLSREEIKDIVEKISGGSLYSHRDTISDGYISMGDGIRVGVCGFARYEYKSFVGVSEMRSLVFRIPTGECEFADELYSVWQEGVGSGMLIYSPPGGGKTTALRSLAERLGRLDSLRVAIVDERCEFSEEDYERCEVDILKGYKRKKGIEIATRTMSSDVIIIDEIGGEDASDLLGVVRCGIPIVATAHAKDFSEIASKPSLEPLFGCGAFDTFVGISRTESGYHLTVDRK